MLYLSILLPVVLLGWGISELVNDDDSSDGEAINGTDGPDDLDGLGGNDVISGGAGADNIEGGTGADLLQGEDGDDVIEGEQQNDTINGGAGSDFIQSGRGDDVATGGAEADWIEGNAGADIVRGDAGNDTLIGGRGADDLAGGDGDDLIVSGDVAGTPLRFEDLKSLRDGAALADLLGVPEDTALTISDDGDADSLIGGEGDDTLIFGAGDTARGAGGTDTFVVMEDQAEGGPATIEAIEPDETIAILARDDGTDPEVTVEAEGEDGLISLDGVLVARVQGGAALQASDIVLLDPITVGAVDPNR
ncbi:MAG: calcium-binding protein [Pseudomonadota bacterium]